MAYLIKDVLIELSGSALPNSSCQLDLGLQVIVCETKLLCHLFKFMEL